MKMAEPNKVKRKMKRKMVYAFAGVFLALTLVGATYAAWFDTILIEGTAYTGEFQVGILELGTWWESTNGIPEDTPLADQTVPPASGKFDPKPWVANSLVELGGVEPRECGWCMDAYDQVYHKMTITIDNAYPQYDLHIPFYWANTGTIPAKLVPSVPTGLVGAWVEVADGYEFDGYWARNDDGVTPAATVYIWLEKDGRSKTADQYHPAECVYREVPIYDDSVPPEIIGYEKVLVGVEGKLRGMIEIDFLQEAEECEIYTFEWLLKFVQWNKLYEADIIKWADAPWTQIK